MHSSQLLSWCPLCPGEQETNFPWSTLWPTSLSSGHSVCLALKSPQIMTHPHKWAEDHQSLPPIHVSPLKRPGTPQKPLMSTAQGGPTRIFNYSPWDSRFNIEAMRKTRARGQSHQSFLSRRTSSSRSSASAGISWTLINM